MKEFLKGQFPAGSFGRWILVGMAGSPFRFPLALLSSVLASWRLTGKPFPVLVRIAAGQKFRISVGKDTKVSLLGVLSVNPWGGCFVPSSLSISDGAVFKMESDFEIGPNVHLSLNKGSSLRIAGKRDSSGSGITCDSRVMVDKSISIGADTIIAWGVFISDSDWHEVAGSARTSPVDIGDRVWIGQGVSILKGACVPAGCIVGAHSLVNGSEFPADSLIAGNPAVVKREGVSWTR